MAEAWGFLSLAPATLWQLVGQCTLEAWGSGYQNINGFHCQPWPLSLISIIAVLFITGPTRRTGWGGWQNRRGLDLLTAEKRGLCLFLSEKCCFYVDHSEIVRDMAQQLREQIIKRREKLANSWGNWSNIWSWASWLLPLTGPLFMLFVALLFGPCILNAITSS